MGGAVITCVMNSTLANAQIETLREMAGLLERLGIWKALIVIAIANLPTLIAWIIQSLSQRKIEKLYQQRIMDKDEEIKRQAIRIKSLENHLLKTKRD